MNSHAHERTMPQNFYQERDFCEFWGDAENIQINCTVSAFAELVSENSIMRHQSGKHYQNAVRILKEQIHYIVTAQEAKWDGVRAFEPIREALTTVR